MYDPLVYVFLGLTGLASMIIIYLVAKHVSFKKRQVEEAKAAVEEELGETLPDEVIRRIIEKRTEETAERELKKLEEKQRIKQVKKANKGLLKLRKRLIVVFAKKGGMPPEVVEIGRAHSYDRYSLDGKEDIFVIYYYPKHNSIILNGLQALIAKFGRGRHRLQVPAGAVIVGDKVTIIYADHIKSIAPHTYEVVPPEEIRFEHDIGLIYREAYRATLEITEELIENFEKPYRRALSFRRAEPYYLPGLERSEFFPTEASEDVLERLEDVWARLKMHRRSLGGENND